jgi:threonine synthase
MQCLSTRGNDRAPIGEALQRGLARDGGLYVPEHLPHFELRDFDGAETLPAVATRMLRPFFEDSPLADAIGSICFEAFNFPVPLVALPEASSHVLELFHGPTAAFKDIGARFLAGCLGQLRDPFSPDVTVLAATSGDTGSAVAAAFHQRPGFAAAILFPDGRVSPRQAHLLSCFGDNIASYAVQGSFDDCQAMVKAAFADADLQAQRPLTSANSISLGRLLPQAAYYAYCALGHWRAQGELLNFVIPTGNLGNGLAAIYARSMGLPIGEIVFGTNANRVLPDFLASGEYRPAPSIATIANAMDVGAPSNLERLRALFSTHADLVAQVSAYSVDDARIRARILRFHREQGRVICPHTAIAAELLAEIRSRGDRRPWCIVATAHPAKFESVVEPLIGTQVEVPPSMRYWLARPAQAARLEASSAALRHNLLHTH